MSLNRSRKNVTQNWGNTAELKILHRMTVQVVLYNLLYKTTSKCLPTIVNQHAEKGFKKHV